MDSEVANGCPEIVEMAVACRGHRVSLLAGMAAAVVMVRPAASGKRGGVSSKYGGSRRYRCQSAARRSGMLWVGGGPGRPGRGDR